MPICFELTLKGEKEPMVLTTVDEMICEHLELPVDKDRWCLDWYQVIGMSLAFGKSFEDVREYLSKDGEAALLEVLDYLEMHFTVYAYREN